MAGLKPLGDLLSISEACALLKCHPNTLRYWDKIGVLKAIRFGKRGDRRYKKEDIVKLVNSNTPKPTTIEGHDIDFFKLEFDKALERIGHFQVVISSLSGVLTPHDAADVIIRQGMQAMGASSGLVALLHNDGALLRVLHAVGFNKKELKPWEDLPVTAPVHLADAVRSGNVIFIESIEEGKIRYPLTTKIAQASNNVAFAAAPLTIKDRTFGVLCLSFSSVHKFSEADRLFMQAIARQCAQALERSRLYESERQAITKAEDEKNKVANILENITDAFITYDKNWHYIYVNNQAEMLIGKKREELLGKDLRDVFPRALHTYSGKMFKRTMKTGKATQFESYYPPREKWFLTKIYKTREGLVTYFQDITERKAAEDELRKRLEQQAAVAAFGQFALKNNDLTSTLQEAAKILGETLHTPFAKVLKLLPSKKELLYQAGIGWKKGVFGHTRISAEKNSLGGYALHHRKPIVFKNVASEKRFAIPDVFLKHKIKSGVHVIITGAKGPYGILGACSKDEQRFSQDDINFIQSIANIVGEAILQKQSQEDLRESEERYRSIVEGVRDYAIFTFDTNGQITSWNKGAERLLGYTEEEIIGKNNEIFFSDEEQKSKKPKREIHAAIEKGSVEDENWAVRRDKSSFWASGITTAIRNEKGEIIDLVKILRDMSSAKQVEKEKDDFVSLISHELKIPITSLSLYTQLLQKRLLKAKDESSNKYVINIQSQTDRITHLISNLLEQSKVRAKKFTFNDTVFDCNDVVKEVVGEFRRSKATHKIIVNGKATQKVFADKERIGQVLENLISNAIKYSPDADRIIITLATDKANLTISVQDFGMGISKDNITKIFGPFFRASETQRESFPSIGLGLYIAAEIVKYYGGRIWVMSTEGKGSTFYFKIPHFNAT
jgi:PAS domain S-box-containing protein